MEKNRFTHQIKRGAIWLLLAFMAVYFSACATPTSEVVEVTRQVTVEVPVVEEVEVTRLVEVEVEKEVEVTREVVVEVTKLVEVTPMPEPTATPQPKEENPNVFALNYLGQVESGGLEVEVLRVSIASRQDLPERVRDPLDRNSNFDGVDVLCFIAFRIKNNSDQKISVYPHQGTIQVNSEQIELLDYSYSSTVADDVSGDIFPDAEKIGGFWFGINRNEPVDINSMIVRFDGPRNEDFSKIGADFELSLDLSDHRDDELPAELGGNN